MPDLDRDGEVFVLDLGADENRFNPEWVGAVTALLDEVVGSDGPRALVTHATGKFWSNGLDLAWLSEHPEQARPFVDGVHALLARLLSLPVPAVAACQGHVFAAGAMLALAHDARVMRSDRGFFCLPEVDIGIPFTPGMAGLIQARLAPQTAHEAMTTGRRYGGLEAAVAGIVDEAVEEARVLSLPVPSVAACQGHVFAAGAMLALAHDFRVMRADRGFFCLPEVDIHIPFTPGMGALIQARLSHRTAHEAMTTGRRYGGADAMRAGIVDDAVGEDAVLQTALDRAGALASKAGPTLGTIKEGMYAEPLRLLRTRTGS